VRVCRCGSDSWKWLGRGVDSADHDVDVHSLVLCGELFRQSSSRRCHDVDPVMGSLVLHEQRIVANDVCTDRDQPVRKLTMLNGLAHFGSTNRHTGKSTVMDGVCGAKDRCADNASSDCQHGGRVAVAEEREREKMDVRQRQ
jgi:hypothetical protein